MPQAIQVCVGIPWLGVPGGSPGGLPPGLGRRAGHGVICDSVVLKQSEQIIVAAGGEVRRAQVGQQLVGVRQFWE